MDSSNYQRYMHHNKARWMIYSTSTRLPRVITIDWRETIAKMFCWVMTTFSSKFSISSNWAMASTNLPSLERFCWKIAWKVVHILMHSRPIFHFQIAIVALSLSTVFRILRCPLLSLLGSRPIINFKTSGSKLTRFFPNKKIRKPGWSSSTFPLSFLKSITHILAVRKLSVFPTKKYKCCWTELKYILALTWINMLYVPSLSTTLLCCAKNIPLG